MVTGYGERDRSSFIGSASVLGNEQIEDHPFGNVEQALQGNVAGPSEQLLMTVRC
ncbi:hypothetical protein [Christiangramia sp.]|uniref:hypothetical protein n=1 Tax=Christiangramia sp. TaxID=1931228 RepID=UPI0026292947|nr:hypothetical protein [Christiangramia sp.]